MKRVGREHGTLVPGCVSACGDCGAMQQDVMLSPPKYDQDRPLLCAFPRNVSSFAVVFWLYTLVSATGAASSDSLAFPASSDSAAPPSLGEIVVTARSLSPPSTIFEISRADMETRGVRTVAEALETVPGVTVSVGRKNEVAVQLRGADPKRVLVLLDGRPMNMPYYGKIDLRTVPVDRVERIKVLLGAASLLYGPNAAGGVINIITRRGPGHEAVSAGIDIGVSPYAPEALHDDGTCSGGAFCAGELGRWHWSASIGADRSSGFFLPAGYDPPAYVAQRGGLRDNSDYAVLNAEGSVGLRAGDQFEAAVAGGYHVEEKGIPADIYHPEYNRFDDWRRSFVDIMTRVAVGGSGRVKGRLYYDALRNLYVTYAGASFDSVTNRSLHENWDWGAELFGDMPIGPTTLAGSARIRQDVANVRRADTARWQTYEIVS
ncbi:MAG: TonB-dependent receptor plug domain-containing protein, partial [Chitinivibrionales bacterium]|nr:TonB-dependent receptor plug domain-containing protein [Chitinivibrionales bacterium]